MPRGGRWIRSASEPTSISTASTRGRSFSWLEAGLAIGTARLRVTARIDRCAAIDVEPGSGARNTNLMRMLSKRFDHVDMGVYATVTAGGEIALGDALKPEG